MHKNSLIHSRLVNFIYVKFPNFLYIPIIEILFCLQRSKSLKNKKVNKRNKTLELIESITSRYNKLVMNKKRKLRKLLNFQGNFNKRMKISFLNDNLQLYLLRNLLYRILDKCITVPKIRELVKIEILRAPEKTFSDFVHLFYELKKELDFVS